MTSYLLDTNIVSDLVYDPEGRVAHYLRAVPPDAVFTSIIVECELRYGAAKRESPRLTAQIEAVFDGLRVEPLGPPTEILYANLRADLERRGVVIGQLDMLIAAHALALDATLVTANLREFERVEGLRVENWLA